MFRARAALAVEVAPGKVLWYQIEIDPIEGCEVDIRQDDEEIHSWEHVGPLAYVRTRPLYIRAQLSGYAVSNNPGWSPAARADSRLGDHPAIEAAPRGFPGGSR